MTCVERFINRKLSVSLFAVVILAYSNRVVAQQNPPNPIRIYAYPDQGLRFGAFTQGVVGGSVIIAPTGLRTTTGDVIQLSLGHTFSAALFEIEGESGTRIQILKGADVYLVGSTGGTIRLEIGETDPVSPFIITSPAPSRKQVRIGGILHLGSPLANPPGVYNGSFSITFIQE